jgi:hypothetical protein
VFIGHLSFMAPMGAPIIGNAANFVEKIDDLAGDFC